MALALAFMKEGNKRSALSEFRKVVEFAPKSEAARVAKDYIATLDADPLQPKKKK
jgi:Tfp pilus assembly protein PilF